MTPARFAARFTMACTLRVVRRPPRRETNAAVSQARVATQAHQRLAGGSGSSTLRSFSPLPRMASLTRLSRGSTPPHDDDTLRSPGDVKGAGDATGALQPHFSHWAVKVLDVGIADAVSLGPP